MKSKLFEHFAPQLLILVIVLVLVLNGALVMGIQIAVEYPLTTPQGPFTAEGDWEILDLYVTDRVSGYIVWQNHSQWRLVITERHFHANRWRVICDNILMEQDFSGEFPIKTGRAIAKLHGYAEFDQFYWVSSPVFRALRVPADFLLWNLVLLFLEAAACLLLWKLRRE